MALQFSDTHVYRCRSQNSNSRPRNGMEPAKRPVASAGKEEAISPSHDEADDSQDRSRLCPFALVREDQEGEAGAELADSHERGVGFREALVSGSGESVLGSSVRPKDLEKPTGSTSAWAPVATASMAKTTATALNDVGMM
ncbi:hypothetical protein LTR94_014977 [Friedmanniomyces endolithicus]|nr:hypothetical protein LTR94_014977 [Friedmanniomyces endolithicus]